MRAKFAIMGFLCLLAIVVSVLSVYFFAQGEAQTILFVCAIVLPMLLFFLLGLYVTRKERSDLRSNQTLSKEVVAREFLNCKDVEPGSGVLYIPILGDLFPRLYNQKMREKSVSYIITEDGTRYEVAEEMEQNEGGKYNLIFSRSSQHYIGCELA